jgi:hypothetical protein
MTVGELIEKLGQFDPELPAYGRSVEYGEIEPLALVGQEKHRRRVWTKVETVDTSGPSPHPAVAWVDRVVEEEVVVLS